MILLSSTKNTQGQIALIFTSSKLQPGNWNIRYTFIN